MEALRNEAAPMEAKGSADEDMPLDLSNAPTLAFSVLDSDADFLAGTELDLDVPDLVGIDDILSFADPRLDHTNGEASGMGGKGGDLDLNLLSDLLQQTDSASKSLLTPSTTSSSSPTPSSSSQTDAVSPLVRDADVSGGSPALDTSGSTEEDEASMSSGSDQQQQLAPLKSKDYESTAIDRKAKRRAQVAVSARRLRCRKKTERMTLRKDVVVLSQQLEALRVKHKLLRADSSLAEWEEKAIAQRHKRQQAEQLNEQLRRALAQHSGFIRNLKSVFMVSFPVNMDLNMHHFLHSYTHLRADSNSRAVDLNAACTNAKLDMAQRIVLNETQATQAFTTPNVTWSQLNLGPTALGMTSVAVYAIDTMNACKTFQAACYAILNCEAVWPNYSLVASSAKNVNLPPTNLHIRYNVSQQLYQSDTTSDEVSVEERKVSYCRMTDRCGVFVWDSVDEDDLYPVQKRSTTVRSTVGAVVVRPEVCADGVERIVCRNICTKTHIVDQSKLSSSMTQFLQSRQLCAQICSSLVYESIKGNVANGSIVAV